MQSLAINHVREIISATTRFLTMKHVTQLCIRCRYVATARLPEALAN